MYLPSSQPSLSIASRYARHTRRSIPSDNFQR